MKNKYMLLLFSFFIVILFSGIISSFEWDNIKNYDEETKTIDVRNSILGIPFLQLGKVAEIQLNTPQNYFVPAGYQKVAEFQVSAFSDYTNSFKELELYDKTDNNRKFTRDFDYKYKTIQQVPDYERVCDESFSENGTITLTNCKQEQIGLKDEVIWVDLGLSDFRDGDVKTIGIFTHVEISDRVEWIPNLFGVRINEWAIWTQSLNVQILGFWNFSETSGTNAVDGTGNVNLTASSGILNGTSGILGTSADFNGGVFHLVNSTTTSITSTGNTWTISIWFNGTSTSTQNVIDNRQDGGVGLQLQFSNPNFRILDSVGSIDNLDALGDVLNGTWNHVVVAGDGAVFRYYLNGVSITNVSATNTNIRSDGASWVIGGFRPNGGDGGQDAAGLMDEIGVWNRTLSIAEVQQLYNNASAISFTDIFGPGITINAPNNGAMFSTNNVAFDATVTHRIGVQNVTLFIDGVLNETNSSGVNGTYIFDRNLSEGNHNWSIGAISDDDLISNSSLRTFTIDTLAPNITILAPIGIINFIRIGDNETVNWNITGADLDTCLLEYNGANTTLNCTANTTGFLYVLGINNLNLHANDTSGNSRSEFTSWDYNITEINQTFNSPVFTTSTQTFITNITINSNFTDTPTAPSLIYNGTTTTGGTVASLGGDNFSFTQTIDIPNIANGTSDWLFTFNLNSSIFNSGTSIQNVTQVDLVNCNQNSFINFTFRNETLTEGNVNATFDSAWNYFLGSGSVRRTLSFTNASENSFYGFCLNAVNDVLSTQVNVSYTNSISQQRQFRPTLLTLSNVTLNQVLYLLPTSEGIFSQFRTQDNVGNTLVGVLGTITRILNGNPITSAIDVTDGAGLVSFFLDPDITYTAVFSFSGFNDNTFNFNPTSDLTTIVMGGVAAPGEGSNISLGTSYTILPLNSTLQNGTAVTFEFNVSSLETITFMGLNISNGTTTLLLVNQTSNGSISGTINTGTNRTFIGVFTFNTSEESITITRIWPILEGFLGDYSIQRQGDLFLTYEFSNFIRLLIIVGFIIAVMIFISAPNDPEDELRIAVMIAMVWFFSFIGWLDTGLQVTTASSNINALTQFSNQFGIAILTTAAGFYFILRRTLRQI